MNHVISIIIQKLLRRNKFVSFWAILMADSFLSTFATLVTLLFVSSFIERIGGRQYAVLIPLSFIVSGVFFYLLKMERRIIRHSTLKSVQRLVQGVLLKEALFATVILVYDYFFHIIYPGAFLFIDFCITSIFLIFFRVGLIVFYDFAITRYLSAKTRVLIYGTSENSISLCKRLYGDRKYQVIGFLQLDNNLKPCEINDQPVYTFDSEDALNAFVETRNVKAIIFATEREAKAESNRLLSYAEHMNVKTMVAPPVGEYSESKRPAIREVKIEDLLGRDEINVNMVAITHHFADKVVMVTGAAGSIGSELCRQLATFGVKQLILFDNAETPMHEFRLELERTQPELSFIPYIGDVRQEHRLRSAFTRFKPQIVFHAAAYKHVPLMEENPCEAALVNIIGSRQVADFCLEYDVEEMVMISTDKAVNPTNVMGASKRMAEIYVQSLSAGIERGEIKGKTRFTTTRFGNVLGSNGSVIPYFRKQIEQGGPVTVTHPDITRYFMTIPEACRLVMEAATLSLGNQIFVFDMGESVRILDMAERMIRLAGFVPYKEIDIAFTGLRPGEKLYEEVLSDKENTQPTTNKKIRIASVREYNHADILTYYDSVAQLARRVEVDECVRMMKQLIPEFVSNNSQFAKFDVKVKVG